MFYNFAPPKSGPLVKQRKVRRACDFCRLHRVRCDGTLPCSQCVANRVQCVKPKPGQPPSRPASCPQTQSIRPSTVSSVPLPQPARRLAPNRPASSEQAAPVVAGHLDCLTGFISRINTFCSAVSQMSAQISPQSGESAPSDGSYSTSDLLRVAVQPTSSLSSSSAFSLPEELQRSLMQIFWSRYYALAPVVSSTDVLESDSGSKRKALREALLAYCLQSVYHAGLHHRLLGVSTGFGNIKDSVSHSAQHPVVSGFAVHFRKALAANSHYLLYAEPSMSDVQRHVLMALFLVNSGEFLAAYNITGAAIRLSQALDLQIAAPSHLPAQEAEIRERVWWMLVHLDFHCARYLGKPMIASLSAITLAIPELHSAPNPAAPELVFHSATVTLTVVGKKVAESLAAKHGTIQEKDSSRQIELSAEHLTQEVGRLHEWRDHITDTEPFQNLVLVSNASQPQTSASVDGSQHDHEAWMHHEPPTRILQQTLLELQYHDIIIWLHRPFIQFPSRGLTPQRSPGADVHATTALQHSLTVTDVVRRRMLNHDALYGCSDIYQYVWNAVLTLIGFMLAYPLCYWFPDARQHVELSLEIFETAKTLNPIASRAAHLGRYLLGRVDALMELLNAQASATHRGCHQSASQQVAETWDRVDDVEPHSSVPSLINSQADALSSWADTVDQQTWFGYCHNIDDMLTDLPEILPYTPNMLGHLAS